MTGGRPGSTRATPPPLVIGGDGDVRPDHRLLIPGHGKTPQPPPGTTIQDFGGEAMGATWSVRLVPSPGLDRATVQSAIEEELARFVALFSAWDPRSELSRLNAAPPGFWAVSEPFWTLLNRAMDLADDTNGAVDPTLGALIDLWGFGPSGPRPLDGFGTAYTVPSEDEIIAARAVSGWGLLRLNREARAVQQLGGIRLDLSGIAMGHAVDSVSARLTAMGATHHLVRIGADHRGAGVKPDGYPWWVALKPVAGGTAPHTVAALFDLALSTSTVRARSFDADGRNHGHILDGRTGRPVDNGVASVTVLADTALYADAMATALTVMGPVEGPAWAEALGLAAVFTVQTGDGPIEIVSPAFVAMLSEGAEPETGSAGHDLAPLGVRPDARLSDRAPLDDGDPAGT